MPSGISDVLETALLAKMLRGKKGKGRQESVPSMKRGGKMKRAGVARLHEGEKISGKRKKERIRGR